MTAERTHADERRFHTWVRAEHPEGGPSLVETDVTDEVLALRAEVGVLTAALVNIAAMVPAQGFTVEQVRNAAKCAREALAGTQ